MKTQVLGFLPPKRETCRELQALAWSSPAAAVSWGINSRWRISSLYNSVFKGTNIKKKKKKIL